MNSRGWALTEDVPIAGVVGLGVVLGVSLLWLILELRWRQRYGPSILATGVVALLLVASAILRPVLVQMRGSLVGPHVVVLVDQSRRLLIREAGVARREVALRAIQEIQDRHGDARLRVLGFAAGVSEAWRELAAPPDSDLVAAMSALEAEAGERPAAVVVVSDGRLARPAAGGDRAAVVRAVGGLGVPVHTVSVAATAPHDASIRSVRAAGAAVAHQPIALRVEVGCLGLSCGSLPVTVRELRQNAAPALLATGQAEIREGVAVVELRITLERAGARVVTVSLDAPAGDEIPENDSRTLTFSVARERVRLLHVAGRPTYDVRALRMWLKADESVDLVSFFILRTELDEPQAEESELALIPFPVDELFTQHLSSFDAVVLQDIDAVEYKIKRHLPSLAEYVETGGGLIMVGGAASFVGGLYADTALDRVLPVKLPEGAKPFDAAEFVPVYTVAGRVAPVLRPLRDLFADELPVAPGANTLGEPRAGAIVLLEHPRQQAGHRGMPVLALGEAGDGRSIALGLDSTHFLAFGEFAARAAGRGYAALWDGLLGWLMRDPRYEAARMDLVGECIVGQPTTLRLTRVPGVSGDVKLVLHPLGPAGPTPGSRSISAPAVGPVDISLDSLGPGGYVARAEIGAAPPTRLDFACELGGAAWSDSRPDPQRLQEIAAATGGRAVSAAAVSDLPLPPPTRITAERHVSPVLPPWVWTLAAALALSAHWLVRRRGGLS